MEEIFQRGEENVAMEVQNFQKQLEQNHQSVVRPEEFSFGIEGSLYRRYMQSFNKEYGGFVSEYGGDGGGGVNCIPLVAVDESGILGRSNEVNNSFVKGTEIGIDHTCRKKRGRRRKSSIWNGEGGGDSMHGGVGSNSVRHSTKPLAPLHAGDGRRIEETVHVPESILGQKRKKTETNVPRKLRVKMKKHRPKIFDVMKPKPTPKNINSKEKTKKEKKKKKTEPKMKPNSAKKRRKDSDIDIAYPLTPELLERNHKLGSSSSEEHVKVAYICNNNNQALDYDIGYDHDNGGDNVKTLVNFEISSKEQPQFKVYTRRNQGDQNKDFDFNFNVQESKFSPKLMSMEQQVLVDETEMTEMIEEQRGRTTYDDGLKRILPNLEQYYLAKNEPRHFSCILSLKPISMTRKKRSPRAKSLPLYREIRKKSVFFGYLPLRIPGRKRSDRKRGSCCNDANTSEKIPIMDQNELLETPKEEEREVLRASCCNDADTSEKISMLRVSCCNDAGTIMDQNDLSETPEVYEEKEVVRGSCCNDANTSEKISIMDQNDFLETPKVDEEKEMVRGSCCNDVDKSKKISIMDQNDLPETPKEEEEKEVSRVDGKTSTIISIEEVVEPEMTQRLVHISNNDGFHGRAIRTLNVCYPKLVIKTAEPVAINYPLGDLLDELSRKFTDLSMYDIVNNLIVSIQNQTSNGVLAKVKNMKKKGPKPLIPDANDMKNWALVDPRKIRNRKKKAPEGYDIENWELVDPEKVKTRKKKGHRLQVISDADAMKTWILLKEDGTEKNEENYWRQQNEIFCARVQVFINCMHVIQGNRRFSPWKGSVVDSVVGVLLTQNVADNMSSDCFMRFIARFPKHFVMHNQVPCLEGSAHYDTLNIDVMDEDRSLQNPEASRLEEVTHSEKPRNGVNDEEKNLEHPVAPSFEGVTYSSTPSKGVRDEDKTTKNPTRPDLERASQNIEVFPSGPGEAEAATTNNSKTKVPKSKLPRKEPENQQNWEELRRKYDTLPRHPDNEDAVDWYAVRRAGAHEIEKTIGNRGMQNVLAMHIKNFLDRLQEDHGKIDLEWLRNVPTETVREYLLSFERIGLKSLDCVRLLTLHHHAFPVDTNVGRIVVRLGWVPLQPLPDGVQLHLLNDYPILAAIQEYLWPRLKALDRETLYELHYQMITFGKVFCTKQKPRCNVCPMRKSCRHFASSQSARLRLPSAQVKANEVSNRQITRSVEGVHEAYDDRSGPSINPYQHDSPGQESQRFEPIIEIPKSPERNSFETTVEDIEDFEWNSRGDSEDELFFDLTQTARESKSLDLLVPDATFSARKLKNPRRLHTEHEVYLLPDDHPVLAEFSTREINDKNPYLLAIWMSDTDNQPEDDLTVPATIFIPCRTANRGRFALNGTYFHTNEVFADDETSKNPIRVPRSLLWNLEKGIVYCAPSGRSIFRDISLFEIRNCFWSGFICVRSYNRSTRRPSPLHSRFHLSKVMRKSEEKKTKQTNSVKNSSNNKKKKKMAEQLN